jgi:hypothetical protein
MNKLILFLTAVFLISIISATISTDITLGANTTTALINLDTSGYAFDTQTITYGDFEIEGFVISEFLNGISFEAEFVDNKPIFKSVNISTPYTKMIVDNVLSYLNYTFDSDDINTNVSLMENFTAFYDDFGITTANGSINKTGTIYKIDYKDRLEDFTINYTLNFGNVTMNFAGNLSGMTLTSGSEVVNTIVTLTDTTIIVPVPTPTLSNSNGGNHREEYNYGKKPKTPQITPITNESKGVELEDEVEPIDLTLQKEEEEQFDWLRLGVWMLIIGGIALLSFKLIKKVKEERKND